MEYLLNDPQLSQRLEPNVIDTESGPVEYMDFGSGPVVVAVHGTDDRLVDHDFHTGTYREHLPRVEIYSVEGGDHVAIFTHRNAVRKRVSAFLKDLSAH